MKRILVFILLVSLAGSCKKKSLTINPPCYVCTFVQPNTPSQEWCGFGPTNNLNFYDAQGNRLQLDKCTRK